MVECDSVPRSKNRNLKQQRCAAATTVVYFVLAERVGLVKIGTAEDFEKRFRALEGGSPVPLRAIGTISGAEQVERWCQFHCLADRERYEWFRWSSRTQAFVQNVIAHGPDAAAQLCARERRAELLRLDGRPPFTHLIGPLPRSSQRHEEWRESEEPFITPLGACTCWQCRALLQ